FTSLVFFEAVKLVTMTDELTNINTAHLTAAVNLLHKPLNDGPQSDYDGEDKKKVSTVAVSSPQHSVLNSASLQTNNQTFENLVQAANLSVVPKHVTELDSTIHSHNKSGGNLSQGSLNQSSDNNQHSTNNDLNFESRNTSEDNDTSRSSAVLSQHYENISTDTVTESQKNMAIMHYTVPQANTNVTSAAEYMPSVMPALSQSHPTHFPLQSLTAHPNQHPHQLTTVPQHNMCLQPQFQNQHHTFQESSSQPHIQHPVLLNSLTSAQNSQHSIPSNNNLLSCHGSFPGQIPTQTSTMSETYPLNSYQPSQNTLQSYHNSQQSPHNVPSYSHESAQLSHDTLPPVHNSNTDEKLQQQEDVHSNEPAIANDRSPDYPQQQEEEHSGPAFPTRIENNRCVCCKVHNTEYLYQADTPVLSRARTSLPPCFTLQHTGSSEHPDLMGVWCKECLSERTIFGPMVGQQLKLTNTEFAEQAYGFQPFLLSKGEHETKLLHMVDENICNWMMFVRYAPSLLEQNCTVYRDGDHFYFVTKTEIKEEELLVWFSAEMCLILGITQNPGNHHFHQCEDCGLNFLIKRLLNAHLKSKHPEKYRYNVACYICNKRFKSRRNLMSHLATHMYVKPHSCQYCKKQFADISNLRQHLLIHTAHLENHVVVHTGDKSFNCPHCDASFGRRSDLKVHTYKHTKEVYHPCNVCGKEFFKMQNLKKHLKVHTGERNYMCDKCFKGFQTKYHRDRHLNVCKEKNGKEPSYMSLEEFAKLDSTCDAVPLKKVSDDHEI
ncbi:PRDM4-like protein, partial [Mya arenaria]